MRFRIRSSPAWSERWRCGISRGSSAISRHRVVVDLDRIERGQPQPLELRHQREQAAAQLAERGLPRQIGAEAGDVDAGQHDLAIAGVDQRVAPARTISPTGTRAVVAAAEGNDAEGAAMIAALLHLDEGARAALETVDEMRRGLASAAMMSPTATRAARRRRIALRLQLLVVAEHEIDFRHRGIARRDRSARRSR